MTPPFLGPRFESIQRCLTQAGLSVPPPPLKSWEGHVSPPSADPRWQVINSEMSDIGRVTCAPPPSQTMGGARALLPIPVFNPFRQRSLKQELGHLCPLLKS